MMIVLNYVMEIIKYVCMFCDIDISVINLFCLTDGHQQKPPQRAGQAFGQQSRGKHAVGLISHLKGKH